MNPKDFYTERKSVLEEEFEQLKKRLFRIAMIRFAVFILTVFGIYQTFDDPGTAIFLFLFGAVLFGFLVVKHSNLIKKKELVFQKITINKTELTLFQGKFYSHDHGRDFIDGDHAYSNDIDLFGEYSFFNYLNRTVTIDGRKKLAEDLSSNNIDSIEQKQESIKELSEKVKWRQHFAALANLVKVRYSAREVGHYFLNYISVFSENTRRIPFLFSLASIGMICLTAFQIVPFTILLLWFFIGLGITGSFIKRTQKIYTDSGKAKDTFDQYYQLLQQIEEVEFTSELLQEKQQKIQSSSLKASQVFKDFSKILNAFDHRNNIIIALLGNAFFLWDLRNACRVEKWMSSHKETVQDWFEVIAFFDAQNSLANFCFNYPAYNFPKISNDKSIMKATAFGHPLLDSEHRIDNDFEINQEKFYIITGANMAGKSTFLRTVGLSIVMANVGLPVCAETFQYRPVKLITSMRTSDSLANNESYFYSELKRLKFIVDLMKDDEYFIILDEILKGTNSKDKATGSKKFVEKLVSYNSTGIIATHDVSLCDLEKEYKEIENYFFEAEIKEDELSFDYILKEGICKNMNASFLLKKMKIV